MLALALTGLLGFQEPVPPADPPPAPASAPTPTVAWDDETAKRALAEFGKLMKGSPSLAEKSRALELFAGGSHKALVKPLAQAIEADKSVVVRKRAAELLAHQPKTEATTTIRRLLKHPRVGSVPAVMGELVRGLARTGYERSMWADVGDLFERDYHPDRVPIQEAVLDLVVAHQEKQALPLLLRNLDEPAPENVDDPSNPPAEYWEARWKCWSAWRGKVKDALFAITGQRFSTAAEAKAWLKKNPLK